MARLFPTEEKCICFLQGGLERTGGEQLKPERPRASSGERKRKKEKALLPEKGLFHSGAPSRKGPLESPLAAGRGLQGQDSLPSIQRSCPPWKDPQKEPAKDSPVEAKREREDGGGEGGGEVAAARERGRQRGSPLYPLSGRQTEQSDLARAEDRHIPDLIFLAASHGPTPSWPPPPPPRRATVAPRRPRWTRQSWRPQRWTSATSSTRTRYRGEAHIDGRFSHSGLGCWSP